MREGSIGAYYRPDVIQRSGKTLAHATVEVKPFRTIIKGAKKLLRRFGAGESQGSIHIPWKLNRDIIMDHGLGCTFLPTNPNEQSSNSALPSRLVTPRHIMEKPSLRSARGLSWWLGFKIGAAVCVLLLVFQSLPLTSRTAPLTPLKTWSCKNANPNAQIHQEKVGHTVNVIPNLVHFVYLVEDPSEPEIKFTLHQFIAIYSAYYYLHPERIYIHTNLDEEIIDSILSDCSDTYVQAVGKIPNVVLSHHTAPNKTTSGKKIDKLPNKSDFIRTDVLKTYGGIYLDDDSYVLRDLRPFRYLGFEMVTGRQGNGQICPAALLSTPNNKMIIAYHALQDRVFDGGWATHATDLLTSLVVDFAEPDHQSLILPQDTFFPGSWHKDDLEWLYQLHSEGPNGDPKRRNRPTTNLTDFIDHFKLHPEHDWERDWRLSYVLHGWTSALGKDLKEKERKELFKNPQGGITLDYVLTRRSNFARAVYPAVQDALDSGVISIFQELKVLGEAIPQNKAAEETTVSSSASSSMKN